ncbi:MAG TPA: hypothetical protein VFW29_08785 [Solirubrobacteraceae bacterium]|nr:hypothetical protein [Solirubrobacteraceae bacterium]
MVQYPLTDALPLGRRQLRSPVELPLDVRGNGVEETRQETASAREISACGFSQCGAYGFVAGDNVVAVATSA